MYKHPASYPGAMCCSMACVVFAWAAWINLIDYKHPKIDFLVAYNSRTGNGLVKNSVLPSAAINCSRVFVDGNSSVKFVHILT